MFHPPMVVGLFKQWPSCKGSMLSFVKVLKQEFYAIREEAWLEARLGSAYRGIAVGDY